LENVQGLRLKEKFLVGFGDRGVVAKFGQRPEFVHSAGTLEKLFYPWIFGDFAVEHRVVRHRVGAGMFQLLQHGTWWYGGMMHDTIFLKRKKLDLRQCVRED